MTETPLAPDSEIGLLLQEEQYVALLRHPDCPSEIWFQHVPNHFLAALQNPAFDLFLLEDPGRWQSLIELYADRWCRQGMEELSPSAFTRFAADCAGRVLPLCEEALQTPPFGVRFFVDPFCARKAMEIRRRLIEEKATEEEWKTSVSAIGIIMDLLQEVTNSLKKPKGETPAIFGAAYWAFNSVAAWGYVERLGPTSALNAARWMGKEEEELLWRWSWLQHHLRTQ